VNFSVRRKAAHATGTLIVSFVLATILSEVALRITGFEPRSDASAGKGWVIEPEEGLFRYSERRGYAYGPGDFVVTLPSGLVFRIGHGPDGLRRTAPLTVHREPVAKPEVWILGGSFTHGWSVDDDQTYPWKLQELLPETDVVNFGVGGYGTLLSWLQFEEALDLQPAPAVVVIAYGSFHDERNTWTRSWRRAIAPARPQDARPIPRAVLAGGNSFEVVRQKPGYHAFPLVHVSALSNLLEDKYGRFENRLVLHSRQVTESILLAFRERCAEEGVQLVVAGIMDNDATQRRLEFCAAAGIDTLDISVNLDREGFRNLPHDEHPGSLAHTSYAGRLAAGLRPILSRQ
jgi:hypothetical protein